MKRSSLLALFGIVVSLQAQEPRRLTLREAVELGLNPKVRLGLSMAASNLERARLATVQSRAAMLPSADLRISGGEQSRNLATLGFGGGGAGTPNLRPSFTSFDARLGVSMTLLDLAARKTHAAALRDAQRTQDDLAQEREVVAGQLVRAYYEALRAAQRLETLKANLRLSKELEAAARLRLEAGSITHVDVTRAKAQVAADEVALESGKFEADRTSLTLRRWTGLSYDVPLELGPPQEDPAMPAEVSELMALAERQRQDLASQHKREIVASLRMDASRRKFLPTVSGSADYGPNGLSPADARNTRTLSVSLNLPVFDGGRRKADLTQAEIAYRDELARTRDLQEQIRMDVHVAQRQVQSQRSRWNLTRHEVELAERQLDQARARWKAGLGLELDLSDAQTRLIRARDSLYLARYQLDLAQLDLLVATGSVQRFAVSGEFMSEGGKR